MKYFNINNFKLEKRKNNYLYMLEIKNNIYYLKRILNNNEIVIIKIINDQVEFNSIRNKQKVILNNLEKHIIINDIINALDCDILVDFINFEKITKLIRDSYINIVSFNDLIGLSKVADNLFNIILLKSDGVIGNIRLDYDVKINVDKIYLKDSLDLLSSYLNSKNNLKLIKK